MALRSRILNILCLLYESAISCGLLVSGEASGCLFNGLLVYVVVRNLAGFCENIVMLYSPLRGRIQRWLTVVSEEDIGTERTQNEAAERVGYIERALSSAWDILEGVSTLAVGVSLAFLAATISNPSSNTENPAGESTSSSALQIGGCSTMSALTGVFAAASIVYNVCEIIRMVRRLRGRQGAAVIPPVAVEPTLEDSPEEIPLLAIEPDDRVRQSRRGHRLSEILEDPERRDSRVIEETPLLELGPDNRGRRSRRLSESLEDPERRDSRVIEEIFLVEIEPTVGGSSEEIPLLELEPDNRGRRSRRLSELLTDPDIRETDV